MAESDGTKLVLPMILLATLLFNASLGASSGELSSVVRRPTTILAGLVVNLLVPLAFLIVLRVVLMAWHDIEESNCLHLGLAVVAAMPVAGSSTAWSQNANGNVALSLGLVFASTMFSPLTTPFVLSGIGRLTNDDQADALRAMSGHGTDIFLLACVVIPSAIGVLARCLIGADVIARLKPQLKMTNSRVLLFLCYSNSAVALPQVAVNPDWDFLALVLVAVSALCITAFSSGWLLAKVLGVDGHDQRSLMFDLGMNNNGTGMVLAASGLVTLPWAVVPVLAYNLVQHVVQHVVAGGLSWSIALKESRAALQSE